MRSVNYVVVNAEGNIFQTKDYLLAKKEGNCIVKTYLADIDEKTEEYKKQADAHARKAQKILREKRKGV